MHSNAEFQNIFLLIFANVVDLIETECNSEFGEEKWRENAPLSEKGEVTQNNWYSMREGLVREENAEQDLARVTLINQKIDISESY